MPVPATTPEGPLTPRQIEMARVIAKIFSEAGYPPALQAAAVVNAWAESRLNPRLWSPSGCYGGLFQLGRCGNAAGHGMTRAQIEDPTLNTTKMIAELKSSFGLPVRRALDAGTKDVSLLTALFCQHLLRPGNASVVAKQRSGYVRTMYPSGVSHVA